ncbi:MAG: DNA gyrase/topoisomerase IV subunit A [Bacteroidota bacterium]|nr:DNA gyrase/topoisomerase IV subunit A [Bacteroidota bacterium]
MDEENIKKEGKDQKQLNQNNDIISVSGMYENWFLDYASYVILERAVPHVNDGLKPVQRRILHAMKKLDDGRYNKVANIIGFTMQFHPHGDASIGDALVQLGQKDLLIDMQGNWGNTLTGDSAAAPRYIEARLSKFASEVVFNHKTTEWKLSYDGRNKEPVNLPVKFPLLLAQGVEGIAVGLASKILPHNFVELIDASIAYLRKKSFTLVPDFAFGGLIDVSKYNDGLRGGKIKVRAKIEKTDKDKLTITELPFGKNTSSLIDSIISANEKGKIKIKKIEDKTSDAVNIIVRLNKEVSQDQAIDALYAFTDCEISVSPNSTVIFDDKPEFLPVTEILKRSTDKTLGLLKLELEIEIAELNESLFFSSLEKIFIENKIYQDIEECTTFESIIETIDKGLDPFKKQLLREVTRDDIIKLTEIKIKRISKFDSFKADELMKVLNDKKAIAQNHLDNIVDYTVDYFKHLKIKYGKGRERKSEIRNFGEIIASQVAVANRKLYVNFKEGFAGTDYKDGEFFKDCSELDDVIAFLKDGTYFVTRVSEKFFIGANAIHFDIFNKNDKRTTYNVAYFDGKTGNSYVKRFSVSSIIKEKKYNVTQGHKYSEISYFSVNPNAEAEVVVVKHKPKPRLKKKKFDFDFSTLDIRNRSSKGNLLTKHLIHRITISEKGESTIGDQKIWFDKEILRLKNSETETFLGEFEKNDKIIAIRKNGKYRTTSFELTNHYEFDTIIIAKFNPNKVFNAIYYNAAQGFVYFKRFKFELAETEESFIGDDEKSYLIELTDIEKPLVEIEYKSKSKEKQSVDSEEFIAVKSISARGKRLSKHEIKKIVFIKSEEEKEAEKKQIEEKEVQTEEPTDNNNNSESLIDFEVTMPNGKKKNFNDKN